ncbi:MAG: cyclopropane-fatty-acyl-phospholipid synthase [Francisellaceae bacterium]|jgi:cyclopropane-fatty-acyl-phospholipid synthase
MKAEKDFHDIAKSFDIEINGSRASDIQVHSPDFYKSIISSGSLGLGDAYVDGLWDCENISEFIFKVSRVDGSNIKFKKNLRLMLFLAKHRFFNLQSVKRSVAVCDQHYNLGNDLYEKMLDSELNYSCGYWKNASNLEEAQQNKLDLICRKMYLKPGMRILDVGCGWGSFARFSAKNYGVEVVGITISKEQIKYANDNIDDLPIKFLLQDYRDYEADKFDRIISIGMFEHVGIKNYKTYFNKLNGLLKDDGLFLLHTIGSNETCVDPEPWIEKYIFPNSKLPSIVQITKAMEKFFYFEDVHSFGTDYDKTLMAWNDNFINSWDSIKHNYDERFYRIWTYYLQFCAGGFRGRMNQLWQLVLSKDGVVGGYDSVR